MLGFDFIVLEEFEPDDHWKCMASLYIAVVKLPLGSWYAAVRTRLEPMFDRVMNGEQCSVFMPSADDAATVREARDHYQNRHGVTIKESVCPLHTMNNSYRSFVVQEEMNARWQQYHGIEVGEACIVPNEASTRTTIYNSGSRKGKKFSVTVEGNNLRVTRIALHAEQKAGRVATLPFHDLEISESCIMDVPKERELSVRSQVSAAGVTHGKKFSVNKRKEGGLVVTRVE